ncbi:MAG: type II toxin-antitoxin system VapC family toxin [Maioricimonas sp. JB049]
MTIGPTDLILLDTTILVHWLRGDATGERLLRDYELHCRIERPLLSTTTHGEILGLARMWSWGEQKLTHLRDLLSELVRVDAGLPEVVDAYADLYARSQQNGWGSGENDLWIAASAVACGAVLMTCDTDFVRLQSGGLRVEHIEPEKRGN